MEVKVGQVWLDDHDNEFVVDSCSNDMAIAKYAEFDTTIPLSKSFIVRSCSRIYESEPQLSDLEIVQKALASLKGSIEIDQHGKWWVYLNHLNQTIESDYNGADIKALLTWAKQTVADRCTSHESELSASPAPDSEGE